MKINVISKIVDEASICTKHSHRPSQAALKQEKVR